MKHNLLIFVLLLSICNLNAQSRQDLSNAVQLSDDFKQSQGQLTFHADNRDFCDYYLQISFLNTEGFSGMPTGTSAVVRPGEQQIMNYRVQESATRYSYNYRYAMFRGSIYKKPNVDFAYSLPVVNEETITAKIKENRDGYQLDFELPTDTIYACRGGVICNDELKDHTAKGYRNFNDSRSMSQITAYHDDGTFGEYVFKGKSLVYPGKNIKMGEAIAIIQKDIAKNSVLFSVYFLDKNKVKETNTGNKHTHFRPFFQTFDGKIRLENGKTYICEYTDEVLMQDMTKRERKKFLQKNEKK
ncbi:MAG: hypothetical protein LBI82_01060 [Dysgonamonadaceae bacterium]|jgi:hypothetical protein|nr:hypothetical protein [Dysgonamonadaceae bacterium]